MKKKPTLPRHHVATVGTFVTMKPPPPVRPTVAKAMVQIHEMRQQSVWGRGPEFLGLTRPWSRLDAPGEPPPNFVTATTSRVEWAIWYWLFIIMGVEGDPHHQSDYNYPPPGANGTFRYQINFLGGRHKSGGAVVDFIVPRSPMNGRALILRLEGEWQHIYADQVKIEHDLFQKFSLSGEGLEVIDLYEQHFLPDPFRRRGTIPQVLVDALNGIAWVGPLDAGDPFRMHVSV